MGSPSPADGSSARARDHLTPIDPPTRPWCFERLARADLRAIDDEGRVWTVRGATIAREGDPLAGARPEEVPCPSRGVYALEFSHDGTAAAVVDGRFFIRPNRAAGFVVTPICTDLGGSPWSSRESGGWGVIANGLRSVGPGLLLTREADVRTGWYAVTAIDRSITAGVLDERQSLLALVNEGHLVIVDQRQTVAGEVLAAHGEAFASLSRSAAGVVAAHDTIARRRVLVTARSLDDPVVRVESQRDQTAPTRAVIAVDLARIVALTDNTVELSIDRGHTFRTVLRRASVDGAPALLERPHVGRLSDGRLAVATRDGLAVDRCP